MKTEQNGGKCDNQSSKRHREKETYLHFGAKRGARDGMEDEEEVMRGPEEKSAWWNDCRIEKIREGDGC